MPVEGYPDSIRNAVFESIRSGTTPRELMDKYGIGWGTAYRWLAQLRSRGERVSFKNQVEQFKETAFARFGSGASIQEVQKELSVSRAQVYRWREEFEGVSPPSGSSMSQGPPSSLESFSEGGAPQAAGRKKDVLIRQLKTALAEKTMEADFFKGALQEVEGIRKRSIGSGETPSMDNSAR